MVLYKDKVYNIQIRYQEESQVYLLGTGLRGKEVRTSNFKISTSFLFRASLHTYVEPHLMSFASQCSVANLGLNYISETIYQREINQNSNSD